MKVKTAERWTQRDDMMLGEMRGVVPIEDIALALGRSVEAIKKRSQVLALTKRRLRKRETGAAYCRQLEPLELAEGHFAVDKFSFDAWRSAMSEATKRSYRQHLSASLTDED